MPSSFIRMILVLLGFSPILLSLWLAKIIISWSSLSFFIATNSMSEFLGGILEFLRIHYLLIILFALLFIARFVVSWAVENLSVGTFDVKQIKPADNNLFALLFSFILPFFRIPFAGIHEMVFVVGFIVLSFSYAYIAKNSYHFNLVLSLVLGYKNYEIQSRKEVMYLVLSKEVLINANQFTQYVEISKHMLINVSHEGTDHDRQ